MYVSLTRRIFVEHGKLRDATIPDKIVDTNIINVEKFINELSSFEIERAKHTGHRKNYTVFHYFKIMLPRCWKNCHSVRLVERVMCKKFDLKGLPFFASYEKKGKCKYLVICLSDRDYSDNTFAKCKRGAFQGKNTIKRMTSYLKEIVKNFYSEKNYWRDEVIIVGRKIDYSKMRCKEMIEAKRVNKYIGKIEKLITKRYLELVKYFPDLIFGGAIRLGKKYIAEYDKRRNVSVDNKKYKLPIKNKNELLIREFNERLNDWTHLALQGC